MSRSHVSNTTLSLGSTGAPATPQGKKMGKWKGSQSPLHSESQVVVWN